MSGRRNSAIRSKVINILVIGYQKMKEPPKHQAFVMVVTWNNGERYEVYRRYSDIFSFHTALKEFFPIAAGRGDQERIIPQLPKINFVPVLRSQVTRVTDAKIEQYNLYCRTIISMDPSISESVHVVGFFSPRGGDKELPMLQFRRPVTATLQSFGEAAATPQSLGEETAAFTKTEGKELGVEFEEHYALADFTAEDASQVSFKRGDKVFVKTKDQSGWWLCVANGQIGWAPPTFLKKKEVAAAVAIHVDNVDRDFERSEDSDGYIKVQPSVRRIFLPVVDKNYHQQQEEEGPASSGLEEEEVMAEEYVTIESYQADGPGQVSFKEGENVHVLEKLEDGWWFVSTGGQEGWAPCSYLERLNGEDEEEEEIVASLDNIEKYYSVDDYEGEEDDEISFPEGAVVDVLQKRLDGWWLVRYEDQTGLAPGTFLRKAQADLPIITENQESDSFLAPDSKRREALAYENVQLQLQMARAQPPRRKSMRQWVKSKNRAPAVLPRQNTPPKKAAAGRDDYINHQPHLGEVDLNLKQEAGATKSKTLGVLHEREEKRSIRAVLQGRGGVKKKVNSFEGEDPIQGQLPIMMMKPGMPRARIRNRKLAQTTGGERGGEVRGGDVDQMAAAARSQAQPKIKPRTKVPNTSSLNDPVAISDEPPPPPLPPKSPRRSTPDIASPTRRSPPNVTSPTRKSSSSHVSSPTRTSHTAAAAANSPPPLGPGHPSHYDAPPSVARQGHPPLDRSRGRSHDRSHDQPPPLGPGHPLRPDDDDDEFPPPRNPPRPSRSVLERARIEKTSRLLVPSTSDDLESVHSSPAMMSSKSYPRNKLKQKVKKTRSQTAADERFQDARPTSRDNQSVTRLGSAKVSTSLVGTSPINREVGGASGGGGIPFSDDFTAMLIKHILDSDNPSLKAKLKNMIENNDETRNSLTDILQ